MSNSANHKTLLAVADGATRNAAWLLFAEYCRLRECGLRKPAFSQLNSFLEQYRLWSRKDQFEFAIFLCSNAEVSGLADYGLLPQSLRVEIEKTLLEWVEQKPLDSRPYRWLARFMQHDTIEKALEVNPHDDLAREFLLGQISYDFYYATHHLPDGYIGELEEDLWMEQIARAQIQQLSDAERQRVWTKDIDEEVVLVHSYRDWKLYGSDLSFQNWAEKNNREYSRGITRVYYSE